MQGAPDEQDAQMQQKVLHPLRQKQEVTLLLVGESEHEKADLVSFFNNLCHGIPLSTMINTSPADAASAPSSDRVEETRIQSDSCNLRIVRAPRLTSSSGIPQLFETPKQLAQSFHQCAPFFDAVLLMVDGTREEPTDAVNYMLKALATVLPSLLLDNVVVLFMNCIESTQKMETTNLPAPFPECISWAFQNPLPLCRTYRSLDRPRPSQLTQLRGQYEEALYTMGELFTWISTTDKKSTERVSELKLNLQHLEERLGNILQASSTLISLRQKHFEQRKLRNERKKSKHLKTNEAARDLVESEIQQIQAKIEGFRTQMDILESYISDAHKRALAETKIINEGSLISDLCDLFRSHKTLLDKTPPMLGSAETDEMIGRLNQWIDILRVGGGGDCMLPGLFPSKSALDPTKPKKRLTILLVGQTGSGKTAFASLLQNLFRGYGALELEDENNEDAESGRQQQESQTNKATLYTIESPEGSTIQVLDTPGLGDTSGFARDVEHKLIIKNAINELLTTIDAIVIMANGTSARIDVTTAYVLKTLSSLFPTSIVQNICVIYTHCDRYTRNLEVKIADDVQTRSWTLQNPLALHKQYQNDVAAGLPEAELEAGHKKLTQVYAETVHTLNEWIRWVDGCQARPTHEVVRLYGIVARIEEEVARAIEVMTSLSTNQRALKADLDRADDNRADQIELDKLRNQTFEYWTRVDSDEFHTICTAPGCNSNCHSPCSLGPYLFPVSSADIGRKCTAFHPDETLDYFPDDDYDGFLNMFQTNDTCNSLQCSQCPHKAKEHRYKKYRHEKRTQSLYPKAEIDYGQAQTRGQQLEALINYAQTEIDGIQSSLDQAEANIIGLVNEFTSLSLNKDFAGVVGDAIQRFESRLAELQNSGGTQDEHATMRDAINQLRHKLIPPTAQ